MRLHRHLPGTLAVRSRSEGVGHGCLASGRVGVLLVLAGGGCGDTEGVTRLAGTDQPVVHQHFAPIDVGAGDPRADQGELGSPRAEGAQVDEIDGDGDGHPRGIDCDDGDASVHPGAVEVWYDGVDSDCDGRDDDADEDGFLAVDDCDDQDASFRPDAADAWYDGVDHNCDAADDFDADGDGYPLGDDCDDGEATTHPGAVEVWYDGVDANCDGADDFDADGDGHLLGDDCDDGEAATHPGAVEVWYDGVDSNCDGADDFDADCDGYGLGDDCDDCTGTTHPGAVEAWYDGLDANCDGANDYDADRDGYELGEDCDDGNPAVSPAGVEVCYDGLDNDCNGLATECRLEGELDLDDIGFRLTGHSVDEEAGYTIAVAGDANGDGFADFLVHAPGLVVEGVEVGGDYLLSGPITASGQLVDAATAIIGGSSEGQRFGLAIGSYGDVDGDGYDDLLIGGPGSGGMYGTGGFYLFFSPLSGAVGELDYDYAVRGEERWDGAGRAGVPAGDYTGDGRDDVGVGSNGFMVGSDGVGAAYIVEGPITADVDLGDAWVRLVGEGEGAWMGSTLLATADLNGDGFADLVSCAYSDDVAYFDGGAVYMMAGPVSGSVTSSDASAAWYPESEGAYAGRELSEAGDVDGDGYEDIWIGAPRQGAGGVAYLMRGPATGIASLGDAYATVEGDTDSAQVGFSVAGGGDLDGDGTPDVVIGSNVGREYSTVGGFGGIFYDLPVGSSELLDADVLFYTTRDWAQATYTLEVVGDVDSDGAIDILVGAKGYDDPENRTGAVWLVPGIGL